MKANIAIPNAPNQPTSNTDLYTPKTPMKPNTIPRSTINGKPSITAMNANIAIIIAKTMIDNNEAAIALGNEDSWLNTFDASQTGIEIIIQDIIKPIIAYAIVGTAI